MGSGGQKSVGWCPECGKSVTKDWPNPWCPKCSARLPGSITEGLSSIVTTMADAPVQTSEVSATSEPACSGSGEQGSSSDVPSILKHPWALGGLVVSNLIYVVAFKPDYAQGQKNFWVVGLIGALAGAAVGAIIKRLNRH
jgi:hypothetical protein